MNLLFYTPVQIAFLIALLVAVSIAFGYYAAKYAYGDSAMNEKNKKLYAKVNKFGLNIQSLTKKHDDRQAEINSLRDDLENESKRCKLLEEANEQIEFEKHKYGVDKWNEGYCCGKGLEIPLKKQVQEQEQVQEKKEEIGKTFVDRAGNITGLKA